jgi:catechol 2,3-dioxygenase-like lactoylglutathione lyase family enzyme
MPALAMAAAVAHERPLGHISFGVRSYDTSKAFYNAVLAPLGLTLVYNSETPTLASSSTPKPRTLGYGPATSPEMELLDLFEYGVSAHAPGLAFHVAFNAPTRQAVDDFHEAAMANGGTDNGRPGLRPSYGESYYSAYVFDPDGYRLEAVCKAPQ